MTTATDAMSIDEIAEQLTSSPADRSDLGDNYVDAKKRFTESVKEYRSNALNEIDEQIAAKTRIRENHIRTARNSIWEINDLKMQREAVQNSSESRTEAIQASFDALLKHQMVDAVGVKELPGVGTNSKMLLIKTKQIDMTNPATGDTVPLGEFEVTLPLTASQSNFMTVLNKTNARRDLDRGETWHHPHINEEGDPCFGSIEADMFDMLAKGEVTGAFELLLQYLKTMNPDDDYGRHWQLWVD